MDTVARILVVALLATGCGRMDFSELHPDAGSAAGSGGDSAAPRCDPNASFGTPVPVVGLNKAADPPNMGTNDEAAYVLADGVTVWFSSDRSGNDKFAAYQASLPADASASASALSSDPTAQRVERPIMLDNGLTMLAAIRAPSGGPFFIGIAHRASLAAHFGPLDATGETMQLQGQNAHDSLDPYMPLEGDGNFVYYALETDSGNHQLMKSTRSGPNTPFGMPAPVQIASVNPSMDVQSPVVTAGERTLYYALVVHMAAPNEIATVYRATSPSGNGMFGPGERQMLVPDASHPSVRPTWVSADDCVLYLTADDGEQGQRKIYVASRPSPL